ncbi:MAG: hypothetical protein DRR42_24830 [Gammaproteobacteria bacterium]|nr:MAG: hypothetical protein DRR42_24830 [Gammaproteobacteria bacterium]
MGKAAMEPQSPMARVPLQQMAAKQASCRAHAASLRDLGQARYRVTAEGWIRFQWAVPVPMGRAAMEPQYRINSGCLHRSISYELFGPKRPRWVICSRYPWR